MKFDKIGYLDTDNTAVNADVDTSKKTNYYILGNDAPYWGFYDVSDDKREELDLHFGANFAMIIRDSGIVTNGIEAEIPFLFRESSDDEITKGALTLDAKKLEFKKGDTISIDLVLLPWGTGTEESDEQVLSVREDSALNNVFVAASTGSVAYDTVVPVIDCENNTAEFTLKGGKGNIAVRINGFTSINCPDIYILGENGNWQTYEMASSNGYDGYSVYYNEDGTYGFSFVYNSQNINDEYVFKVVQ